MKHDPVVHATGQPHERDSVHSNSMYMALATANAVAGAIWPTDAGTPLTGLVGRLAGGQRFRMTTSIVYSMISFGAEGKHTAFLVILGECVPCPRDRKQDLVGLSAVAVVSAGDVRDMLRSLVVLQAAVTILTAALGNTSVVPSCSGSSSLESSARTSNRFLVTVAIPHACNLLVSGELDAAKPHDFAGVLGA